MRGGYSTTVTIANNKEVSGKKNKSLAVIFKGCKNSVDPHKQGKEQTQME